MTKLKGLSSFIEGPEVPHKFKTKITKDLVGLDLVDNTSDMDKPISTATQNALTEEAYARLLADTALSLRIEENKVTNNDGTITVIEGTTKHGLETVPTVISLNMDNDTLVKDEKGVISTGLSIIFNEEIEHFQFLSSTGKIISDIDAAPFLQDKVLYGVAAFKAANTALEITIKGLTHVYTDLITDNHYLAFVIRDFDGITEIFNWDIVDVTYIIDVFQAGPGLTLDKHLFSIKKAETSEKYLIINEDSISVEGIDEAIKEEVDTARENERILTDNLNAEIDRAFLAELTLKTNLDNEVIRAKAAEKALASKIEEGTQSLISYLIKKVTENLANNVREAYLLVETVEGVSTDIDVLIPIYKDSSLKSVVLSDTNESGTSGQFLVLTYILDTGEESVQYLDVSKFLVESEFKDGLLVNSKGEVSVLIDPDSEFISVSDKGVKVSGIKLELSNKLEADSIGDNTEYSDLFAD